MGKWKLGILFDGEKFDIGPVVTASLRLLAFMLVIVFHAAYFRYNELKHAVLDGANAIGTACIRADLLPNADRTEVQRLLLDYTELLRRNNLSLFSRGRTAMGNERTKALKYLYARNGSVVSIAAAEQQY